MVNFKELLGNNNQLQNLLLDTVEEGEVYRLCLTKEEGIIPKNSAKICRIAKNERFTSVSPQ